jgi:hypothetical protein
MLRVGLLEESFKVVYPQSRLALDTTPDGHDVLLVRSVYFLIVVIIVVSRGCNPLRSPLSPLHATCGVLLHAIDGHVRWCCSASIGDCFPSTWDRERLGCLLTGGLLNGKVEQHLGGVPSDVVVRGPLRPWLCPSLSLCLP